MATPIKLRRSAVPGKLPSISQLEFGELAYNTYDGRAYFKRDQGGVGVGVTITLINPWAVGLGSTVFNTFFTDGYVGIAKTDPIYGLDINTNFRVDGTSSVGIRTTPKAEYALDIVGDTRFTGGLYYVGVTTFVGDVTFDNNLRVVGVSTFASSTMINSNLNVTGITTTGNFRVTGVSTLTGDSNFSSNLNVSGITTTGNFRVTGISTLTGDTEFTNAIRVSGVSTFSNPAMINSNLNVTGITTTGNFRVTGFSTITGDSNFSSNLNVSGITTTGNFRVTGFSTITGDSNFSSNLNVSGITTTGNFRVTGISTLTGDVNLTNNLNIGGITTTVNFRATGISTVGVLSATSVDATGIITANSFRPSSGYIQAADGTNSFYIYNTNGNVAFQGTIGASSINNASGNQAINFGTTATPVVLIPNNLSVTGVTTLANSAILNNNLYVAGITTLASPLYATSATLSAPVTINSDLVVSGNVTVGGTTLALTAQNLTIKDKEIILGFTTNTAGNDTSSDTTANHGGIAIASTEGSSLVPFTVSGINTLPSTYKQLLWVKANTMGAGTTDAWLFNYAVGIGSTLVPNGVRLSVGGIQLTDTNVTATKFIGRDGDILFLQGTNIYYSGIGSISTFNANVGVITHFTATNAKVTGISTFANVQIGFGNTDLIVNGNARVTGILTVGTSSITLKGTTNEVFVGADTRIHTTGYDIGNSFVHSTGVELVNASLSGIATFSSSENNIVQTAGTAELNNITVAGISTFTGDLYATSVVVTGAGINTFAYLDVTDDANINNLYNNIGVVTSLSGESLSYTSGTITALTNTDANITGILTAFCVKAEYAIVSYAATITDIKSNVGVITNLSSTTFYNSGIGSISTLLVNSGIVSSLTNTYSNITGILTATDVNVSSAATITTINSGIITSNVGVVSSFRNSYLLTNATSVGIKTADIALGITTNIIGINTSDIEVGDFVYAESIPSDASVTFISVGEIQINTTTTNDYIDTELVTIVRSNNAGIGSIRTLYVNSGIITTLTNTNANITGIITAAYANVSYAATISVINSGIITSNVGVVTDLRSTTFYNSGIGSISTLYVNSGFVTTFNITQSLSAPNLNVTGILTAVDFNTLNIVGSAATITTVNFQILNSSVGVVTHLGSTDFYNSGIGSISTLYVNSGIITTLNINESLSAPQLNVTGISTISYLTGTNISYSGIGTITNFNATESTLTNTNTSGIATVNIIYGTDAQFTGLGTITELRGTNLYYSGLSTAVNFRNTDTIVSGGASISTLKADVGIITHFTATNGYSAGITSLSTLNVNSGVVTTLTATNSTQTYLNGINIYYSGIGSISDLNTNIGIVTFVSGTNLNYTGVATVGFASITNANISGITTINTLLISPNNQLAHLTNGVNLSFSGIGTISEKVITNVGLVTFVSGTNLNYTGIGTIQNLYGLGIGYTSADLEYIDNINIASSGIGTIQTLYANVGVVTTLSGTRATYTQADLTNTYTAGISSISDLRAAVGVVTFISGTNLNYAGVGTINFLKGNNLTYTGIVTLGIVTAQSISTVDFDLGGGGLNFTGIATFVNLQSTNTTAQFLTGTNLNYSGIGTISFLNSVQIQNSGFTTTTSLHVGVGGSILSAVSGIGSVGIGTTAAREKLHVYGNIMYGNDTNTGTARIGVTTTTAITIHETLSRLEYRSVEYQIQASTSGVGATGRYQFTKILAIHNGTVSYNVEYATVGTGTDVATYEVDIDEGIDAGYIRLQATPAQVGITTFVINFVGFRI